MSSTAPVEGPRGAAAILGDIKLSHSVFALPFAAIGLLVGTGQQLPSALLALQIVAAMILARCAAMGFNRLADARFDATNPRTRGRALPSGRVSRGAMTTFVVITSAGFIAVAGSLSTICLVLSPLVLAVLFFYSLTKRFTPWAHLFVGLALGLSPPAAYLAARGAVEADVIPVLWLALSVLFWVGGFDVIYACQDVEHDRREGLAALPARWGTQRALTVARWLHGAMIACLLVAAEIGGWGTLGWVAIHLVSALLVVEHLLVRGGDLTRVNAAFFTINGVVSLAFGALVGADLLLA